MALFKLHLPILDDIKSKGLKPAMLAKVDDAVVRITAGLNIGDIRSVLRGDPAGRSFAAFYLRDGVLIAADTVSRPLEFMLAKKLVGLRARVDAARLADESVAMKDLVPA